MSTFPLKLIEGNYSNRFSKTIQNNSTVVCLRCGSPARANLMTKTRPAAPAQVLGEYVIYCSMSTRFDCAQLLGTYYVNWIAIGPV